MEYEHVVFCFFDELKSNRSNQIVLFRQHGPYKRVKREDTE